MFCLFPIQKHKGPNLTFRKIGNGQPRVIIWTILVELEHPMLHTKFQGHRPFGSGEDFLMFLPYMGMAAILVMWPGPFEQTFVPPSHGDPIWNLASIGPVVFEKMFKECGRQTDGQPYGRRRPTYPISSPMSLRLRWAKNAGVAIETRLHGNKIPSFWRDNQP